MVLNNFRCGFRARATPDNFLADSDLIVLVEYVETELLNGLTGISLVWRIVAKSSQQSITKDMHFPVEDPSLGGIVNWLTFNISYIPRGKARRD